jgi:DNA recombination protein RmuC
MVGRGRRRRSAAVPEAAELYRPDPDLTELVEESSPARPDQTAQSS